MSKRSPRSTAGLLMQDVLKRAKQRINATSHNSDRKYPLFPFPVWTHNPAFELFLKRAKLISESRTFSKLISLVQETATCLTIQKTTTGQGVFFSDKTKLLKCLQKHNSNQIALYCGELLSESEKLDRNYHYWIDIKLDDKTYTIDADPHHTDKEEKQYMASLGNAHLFNHHCENFVGQLDHQWFQNMQFVVIIVDIDKLEALNPEEEIFITYGENYFKPLADWPKDMKISECKCSSCERKDERRKNYFEDSKSILTRETIEQGIETELFVDMLSNLNLRLSSIELVD